MALVASFKESKAIMYHLMTADWVSLQEIPKHSDRSAAKCNFLWKVDVEYQRRKAVNHLFAAWVC